MPKIKYTFLLIFLPLLVGFIFAARYIITYPLSSDSWIHLGIGRYILEQKHIPTHTDISFKEVDSSYTFLTHSWLSDLFFYLSFSKQQESNIAFITFPSLLLSLFLLYKILKRLQIDTVTTSTVLTVTTLISPVYWRLHPFLIAVPLLLGIFLIYLQYKTGLKKNIFFLPPLFLAYANVAGGYIFIPAALLIAITLSETLMFFSKTSKKVFLAFFLPAALTSLAATLLNPVGILVYSYAKTIFEVSISNKLTSSLMGALLISNTNYAKDTPDSTLYAFYLGYFLITVLLSLFLLIRVRGKFLSGFILISPLSIFFILGLMWIKFIPLSAFLTAPVYALCLHEFFKLLKNKGRFLIASQTILLFTLGLFSFFLFLHLPYTPPIKTPFTQIKMMKDAGIDGKVFPVVELAGFSFYNFYPMKGFLDAQDDLFDENEIINTYSGPQKLPISYFENIANTYGITMAISTQATDFLNATLQADPDWIMVYLDTDGIVFLKRAYLSDDYAEKHQIQYIDFSRNLGIDPKNIDPAIAELERFTKKYPQAKLAIGELASLYRVKQDFKKAEETLRRIPEDKWDYIVMTEMGRVQAASGNCSESEKWFQEALKRRSERLLSRTILDLGVLYATCFNDKDTAAHYFKRYNSFTLPPWEREKARQIAKQFGISLDEADTSPQETNK